MLPTFENVKRIWNRLLIYNIAKVDTTSGFMAAILYLLMKYLNCVVGDIGVESADR